VVDPTSIEVSRRAKADRIDARALVQLLVRQQRGEDALGLVEVPDPAVEVARLQVRTLHDLKSKRRREERRVGCLLFAQGIDKAWSAGLAEARPGGTGLQQRHASQRFSGPSPASRL
jgi:transposase